MPNKSDQTQQTEVLFSDAESVEELAKEMIPTYHSELASAVIKYVFRSKAGNRGGQPVPGTVRKLSGAMQHLIQANFVVEVASDIWNTLSPNSRAALVDHLLEHCTGEEDPNDSGASMKWKLRKPDVMEFTSIFERRGVWNENLGSFVGILQRHVDTGSMLRRVQQTVEEHE